MDLSKLGLSPAALTVARALQAYGAVIGDQSGASVELKVENVVARDGYINGDRSPLWSGPAAAARQSAAYARHKQGRS